MIKVEIIFGNNIGKIYDVKPLLLKWPQFKVLKNQAFFNVVTVDVGGVGISWNENIDLSAFELW